MRPGDTVQLLEYKGYKRKARVVADRGRTIEVCNEHEYKQAVADGRKPSGIGFPRQYVKLDGAA